MARSKPFTAEGGCDCGHVRYRMESRPLFVHCCHCRWCQRESGASFALNAMIEADRITLLAAQPELVDTPSASGRGQAIARCRNAASLSGATMPAPDRWSDSSASERSIPPTCCPPTSTSLRPRSSRGSSSHPTRPPYLSTMTARNTGRPRASPAGWSCCPGSRPIRPRLPRAGPDRAPVRPMLRTGLRLTIALAKESA